MNRRLLSQLYETLKNPLVLASLLIGFLSAGALWYSGKFSMVTGREWLGAVLFIVYVILSSADAICTLTLLLRRDNDANANKG